MSMHHAFVNTILTQAPAEWKPAAESIEYSHPAHQGSIAAATNPCSLSGVYQLPEAHSWFQCRLQTTTTVTVQ